MVTEDNFLYIKFNHNILAKYKSPRFLEWIAQYFPGKDLHHLLRKGIDYFIYGFEHNYHIKTVHKKRAYYFALYYEKSLYYLLIYAEKELNIPPDKLKEFGHSKEPQIIQKLFRLLQDTEKQRTKELNRQIADENYIESRRSQTRETQ